MKVQYLIGIVVAITLSPCVHGIPVSVMMPLDLVNPETRQLNNVEHLNYTLATLRANGVYGVMADFWWGLIELQPATYDWTPYLQFVRMAKQNNLTVQPVFSFHQCGGNVGDNVFIPIPSFIYNMDTNKTHNKSNVNFWYTDQDGYQNKEYISLFADEAQIFPLNRSPIMMYYGYMKSFKETFAEFIPHTIDEVQVGLGPAGELRYPSYPDAKWTYCGVGAFQCYDDYALQSLQKVAPKPEWAHGGPKNAGSYNSRPDDAPFFQENQPDNYLSEYGYFFLTWYNRALLVHGNLVLATAQSLLRETGVEVAAKVSGIHWWYGVSSHAAELTAGYLNTLNRNAYRDLATVFKKQRATFDFTCLEMFDQCDNCGDCGPEQLVEQAIKGAREMNTPFAGENALPICGDWGCTKDKFDQVVKQSTQYGTIHRFTFLRMTDDLLKENAMSVFKQFVEEMARAG